MDGNRFFSTNKIIIYIKGIKNFCGFEIEFNGVNEDRFSPNDFNINKSEFLALNSALTYLLDNPKPASNSIEIRSNNELVKNIISGNKRASEMKNEHKRFIELKKELGVNINFVWIPDKSNKQSDLASLEETSESRTVLQKLRGMCYENKKNQPHI